MSYCPHIVCWWYHVSSLCLSLCVFNICRPSMPLFKALWGIWCHLLSFHWLDLGLIQTGRIWVMEVRRIQKFPPPPSPFTKPCFVPSRKVQPILRNESISGHLVFCCLFCPMTLLDAELRLWSMSLGLMQKNGCSHLGTESCLVIFEWLSLISFHLSPIINFINGQFSAGKPQLANVLIWTSTGCAGA